jgi:hypothetical protein
MEWTKPLSVVLVALVALLTGGAALELARTTLAVGGNVTESAVTLAVVGVLVVGAVLVGVRNRRWLRNPDSYW